MIQPDNRKRDPLACVLRLSLALACLVSAAQPAGAEPPTTPDDTPATVRVAFGSDCQSLLVSELNRAEKDILVAIFTVNRKPILAALTAAVRRGVHVTLKYDSETAKDDPMKDAIAHLRNRGVKCVSVNLKPNYASMHHKFAVIDRRRVLTGSYNYTTAASTVNAENLVLIEAPATAALFAAEFERIGER